MKTFFKRVFGQFEPAAAIEKNSSLEFTNPEGETITLKLAELLSLPSLSSGLYAAIKNLSFEIDLAVNTCHSLQQFNSSKPTGNLKLNLGCGYNLKKGWLNVDMSPPAELILDLREKLPFADNSCSMIYSEHFLEHLDYPGTAEVFLKEAFRVLHPGGVFSVGVPDTEWPLREYQQKVAGGYYDTCKMWRHHWCATQLDHINQHFREHGGHKFAYDYETLAKRLSDAGFSGIKKRAFNPDHDTEKRRVGTLYVEAVKADKVVEGDQPRVLQQ